MKKETEIERLNKCIKDDKENADEIIVEQQKEIERLKTENKELGRDYSRANNEFLRLHSIIKEVREYIEKEYEENCIIVDCYDKAITPQDLYSNILEILDKEIKQ